MEGEGEGEVQGEGGGLLAVVRVCWETSPCP